GLEVAGVLRGDATAAVAGSVEVRRTALGREVHLRSDALPVLPSGRFYEVWFVAPDDRPGDPHRISAGTFHPDAHGHSDLTLHAAVDPARFPVVSVTAEDGGDDPGPGREVARLSR
nr:anti-sigma factor [Miltoncostaeaceae bacterium]